MTVPDLPPPPSLIDGAALFLDFDGTLVDLAETPDAIHVSPELAPLLQRLSARLEGRLAIVSGRSIGDLERHLLCTGLAVSGSHGFELRLRDGHHVALGVPDSLDHARERVARYAGSIPGLLVEDKPFGVALHYRKAPQREPEVSAFMDELALDTGLHLLAGKMVRELRPVGADKGVAIRALMTEPDFTGARPVFVGDDVTDEDAFKVASGLGGTGILVGRPRDSAARWRLDNVAAVKLWLEQAILA